MECRNCGAKIKENNILCEICGAQTDNAGVVTGNYFRVDIDNAGKLTKPEKKKRLTVPQIKIIALLCIFLLAGSSAGVYVANRVLNPELVRVLVEPSLEYEWVYLHDGLIYAMKDDSFAIIDKHGEIIMTAPYQVRRIFDGLIYVTQGRGSRITSGIIDKNGEIVIDFIYNHILGFNDGIATVLHDGKFGAINASGELVIPLVYERITNFYDGAAFARKDRYNEWVIIDTAGNITAELKEEYDWILNSTDGLAVAMKNGKSGVINLSEEIILPFEYDWIWNFIEDLFPVGKNDGFWHFDTPQPRPIIKYGYINKNNEVIIPFIYDNAQPFINGLAAVSVDGKFGVIDKSGEVILPFEYDNLFVAGQLIAAEINKKWGIINKAGEILLPFEYDRVISDASDNAGRYSLVCIQKDGKWGILEVRK